MNSTKLRTALAALAICVSTAASAQVGCNLAGPQTPRDISNPTGTNEIRFDFAPPSSEMNLCDIHTHTNAEHKGPGFSVPTPYAGYHGGFRCNATADLTSAELAPLDDVPEGGVKPGETIEVHWVFSTCDRPPAPGLGSCLCDNAQLRVETQVFLVVNESSVAAEFQDYAYAGESGETGRHQPMSLPRNTGDPVTFIGSTTGPGHDNLVCSAAQVTWSVRPQCAKVTAASVNAWMEDNIFNESKSHGVRQLVVDPAQLSQIDG